MNLFQKIWTISLNQNSEILQVVHCFTLNFTWMNLTVKSKFENYFIGISENWHFERKGFFGLFSKWKMITLSKFTGHIFLLLFFFNLYRIIDFITYTVLCIIRQMTIPPPQFYHGLAQTNKVTIITPQNSNKSSDLFWQHDFMLQYTVIHWLI